MPVQHCKTCTCGLTLVQWSDRDDYIDLGDPGQVADVVIACSLDNSYDRTRDGIPYGLPIKLTKDLSPIIDKHLSAIIPDWADVTVYMTEEERLAFRNELVTEIRNWYNSESESESEGAICG